MNELKTENLSCKRGENIVLNNINFSIKSGETLVVKGRNGSGKTTLLRILSNFITSYEGKVLFNDVGINDDNLYNSKFNLIGQNLISSFLPILLVSSVFSSMMIGHWFLVDPTIERIGMKNISKFSSGLSILLAFLVFINIYESSSMFFSSVSENLLKNVVIFLYLSSALLSFGSLKSLQEKSYTGVMASTGLSYLALIVSLGASGTLILSV